MEENTTAADARFMRAALALAERGRGRAEPNPLVGAVIVRDGEVVAEGWHAEYGEGHAEAVALQQAGERAAGATAYITLEPCAHFGKTPPCADALLRAGVARVVYASDDPNPAAGGGAARLRAAGVQVTSGVEDQAARDLNGRFFHRFSERSRRPWVELKLALSLDARIADASGASRWITGAEARAEVQRIRAGHDAVAVGIGTVLADDPLLTARGEPAPRRAPVRIVFDRGLRLPLDSRLARSLGAAPLWVVASRDAPRDRAGALRDLGAKLLEADDLPSALEAIAAEGIDSMLCEGGGLLASALLEEGLVDRLSLFYAPLLLGPGARGAFDGLGETPLGGAMRWRRLRSQGFGPDTLVTLAR